jgi:polysaccharide chain length determinant protein (PEP-CTERM system associated)
MEDSQNQSASLNPEQKLEIVTRRRWIIIVPLCISLTLGLFYALTASKTYEASTTILIQPQKVPSGYVQSLISTDLMQRINTISKLILSRTNLEKIIKEFGLYEDRQDMYLEDKIDGMRKKIQVRQNSRQGSGTAAFSISFTYKDNPALVKDIVNKLAALFMDENLKARESQAMGTSEFLESELEKIKIKLETREQVLAEYRSKNQGALPDELEANLRTLDRLQMQHTDSLNALRDTQNAVALLKSQISRIKETVQNTKTTIQQDGTIVEAPVLSIAQQQYELEKRRLYDLLLKYTKKHPEVIKLAKSVKQLKAKIEEEKEENRKNYLADNTLGTDRTGFVPPGNNVLFQHEYNLKQLENDILNIKKNIREIKKATKVYQKRVEDTPEREQELLSIQRDYNNIRASYNSLLARRLEAELSVNMEKKQKGEQFRIIDYASLPEKPILPDVRIIFMFSIAIGFGIGGGIIFLLEFLNPAIENTEQIENELGLSILASIPPLSQPGDNMKKWIGHVSFSVASMYACTVFSFFAVLNFKGIDKTLSMIKTYINI